MKNEKDFINGVHKKYEKELEKRHRRLKVISTITSACACVCLVISVTLNVLPQFNASADNAISGVTDAESYVLKASGYPKVSYDEAEMEEEYEEAADEVLFSEAAAAPKAETETTSSYKMASVQGDNGIMLKMADSVSNEAEEAPKVSDEDVEKAIIASRRVLADTTVYDKFSYTTDVVTGELGNEIVFYLNWENTETGDSASVCVNSDGFIKNFNKSYERISDKPVPVISQKQALDKAYDFIVKANPDFENYFDKKHASVTYTKYRATYTVSFDPNVDGIMLASGNAMVQMSYLTGDIYFYKTSMPSRVSVADSVKMSDDEVVAIFEKELPMKLEYVEKYDKDTEKMYVDLVYAPDKGSKLVSADGRILDLSYNYGGGVFKENYAMADEAVEEESVKLASGAMLSGAEKAGVEYQSNFYKSEEVLEIIKKYPAFELPEGLKIIDSSLRQRESNFTDKITYILSVTYESEEKGARIEINAETGEILNYYVYDRNYDPVPLKISADTLDKKLADAKLEADKLVKELYPETYSYYEAEENAYRDEYDENDTVGYTYVRYNDGIKYNRDRIYVSIRINDNKAVSINYTFSDCTFPTLEGIITPDEALEIYTENIGFEPKYYSAIGVDESEITVVPNSTASKEKRLYIGYEYTNKYYRIDAHTGECDKVEKIDNYYKDVAFADVKDKELLKMVNTLADMNVIVRTEKLDADKTVTQGEYVELFRSVMPIPETYAAPGDDTEVFGENYDPEKPLTRGNAIKAIVYTKGYREIAEMGDIFKTKFADNDKFDKNIIGYIAIAQGLGILDNYGKGNFAPNDPITKSEAIRLVYAEVTRG